MRPDLRTLAAVLLCAVAIPAQDRPDRQPRPADPLIVRLDADRDGILSAAEIAAAPAVLAGLDRDGDGALSATELRALAPRGAPPAPATAPQPPSPPQPADDGERRALEVLAELDRDRRGHMNVPVDDGRLLRLLVESTGATRIVELGTSNGYSSIWMALGCRAAGGHVTTHEIDPDRAKVAQANLERAGVADRVTIVLGDAHQTVERLEGPIDVVFLDADKDGYLDYLQKLLPKVRAGGLIVAHNMARPRPHPAFVDALTTDPRLETLFFHMTDAGIAVALKKHVVDAGR